MVKDSLKSSVIVQYEGDSVVDDPKAPVHLPKKFFVVEMYTLTLVIFSLVGISQSFHGQPIILSSSGRRL